MKKSEINKENKHYCPKCYLEKKEWVLTTKLAENNLFFCEKHFQNPKVEEKNKEFLCQICQVYEATVSLESNSLQITGKFCQPCAVARLEKWAVWSQEIERKLKLKNGLELAGCRYGKEKEE